MPDKESLQNESEFVTVNGESLGSRADSVVSAELAEKQLQVESELVSVNKPTKVQLNKVDELFVSIETAKEPSLKQAEVVRVVEKINPRLKQYTDKVTVCPLRIHEKQDCAFCEAKNCKDRIARREG